MFLIEKLVHKLLRKIAGLLVSYIKILVLLKIGSKKLYFTANLQPTANVTKNSILCVARILQSCAKYIGNLLGFTENLDLK